MTDKKTIFEENSVLDHSRKFIVLFRNWKSLIEESNLSDFPDYEPLILHSLKTIDVNLAALCAYFIASTQEELSSSDDFH